MSSNYITSVPIKKRRFPPIQPPSPTREEQSSLSVGNDSVQKEDSSQSQESVLSNASIPASSSGLSEANKNSVLEEKGNSEAMNTEMVRRSGSNFKVKIEEQSLTVESVSSTSKVKIEEPSLTVDTFSRAGIDSEEKLVVAGKSAKTELKLAPVEAPALNDISCEQRVGEKSKSEISSTPGITELSLGVKEHSFAAMAGQNSEGNCQNPEKRESVSFNLSLSKGGSSKQGKNDDFGLNTNDANKLRLNWDLNTTMDGWDRPETAVREAEGCFNTTGGTHDMKPLISSIERVGNRVACEEKIHEGHKCRSDGTVLPNLSSWDCNSMGNLQLGLSPSYLLSNLNKKPSSSPVALNSSRDIANLSLHKALSLTGNLNKANIRTVKSEPLDESINHLFKAATAVPKGLQDNIAVKSELVKMYHLAALKSPSFSTLKLVDPRSIKPEPVDEGIRETLKTVEGMSNNSDEKMQDGDDIIGKTIGSTDLAISSDLSKTFEHSLNGKGFHSSREVPQEKLESGRLIAMETMSAFVGHDGDEANVSGMVDTAIAEDEQCRLKLADGVHLDTMRNGEDSTSDEEKINLSGDMIEEDSYGTDYESDANHDLGKFMNAEQGGREEDFEDGEVREPLADSAMEEPVCEKREVQPLNDGDSDKKQMDVVGLPNDDHPRSYIEDRPETEQLTETNNNNTKEFAESAHGEKTNEVEDNKDVVLQESSAVEIPANEADKRRSTMSPLIEHFKSKRKDDPKSLETGQTSDQTTDACQGNVAIVAEDSDEGVKNADVVDKNASALPKGEESLNVDTAAKDANSEGSKSRIINLPRASNSTSPGKTRIVSVRSLPLQAGRLPDVALKGDEIYTGSHKFSRDGHQDQPSRNSRLNFMRGRGRISRRIDNLCGDWDSGRDFVPEFYNDTVEFHVPSYKYASGTDVEFNSYNSRRNGAFAGTGRGGRKSLNEEMPGFHHLSTRRQSPRGREGPSRHGLEMVRRISRNISATRGIGEDGPSLVGPRHGAKFMRGLPNDNTDPMYKHPQPSYEGLDSHLGRGSRNFLSFQRGGTWSSLRRRSPNEFGGHAELPNQRSPPIYRMETMSDNSCYPGELAVRRHGSPYLSRQPNELRDINSGRDFGNQRSVVLNRSPPGRVLLRNSRTGVVDPREKADSDDYFSRPVHPGRFQALGPDVTGEERRRFTERRGPVRPFRPPYNGDEGESIHVNTDGPRLFRFRPDDDSVFHDRGNLREREFDKRIKNRPGNASRRTRNIEKQEGNYTHGGHVWHDDGFDDLSRIKRKRF